MTRTRIDWTDHSLNPGIYGCSPAGAGCRHCYAETMAWRLALMGKKGYDNRECDINPVVYDGRWTGSVRVDFDRIAPAFDKLPKRKPCRVFVTSMGDLFHAAVPGSFLCAVFEAMATRRHLTFQVLTKRPHISEEWSAWWTRERGDWPPNVWIGCSCSTQAEVDRVVPHLLRIPAAVRFLSLEPLLERMYTTAWLQDFSGAGLGAGVDWIVVGCESGPRRRPFRTEWVEDIVEQCQDAGVPVFVKQLHHGPRNEVIHAGHTEWPDWAVQEFPGVEP